MKRFSISGNLSSFLLGVASASLILLFNFRQSENDPVDSCQPFTGCTSIFYAELFSQPPSKLPYNLSDPKRPNYSQFSQDLIMNQRCFHNKTNGVFFEAGAYDGEHLSNTLMYEFKLNWTGVLVEASTSSFQRMLGKNRKAWTFNGCLDNVAVPTRKIFHDMDSGSVVSGTTSTGGVICLPVKAILAALNITHIDYMIIDTEGTEPAIMESIDYNRCKIDFVQIECNPCQGQPTRNSAGIPICARQQELQKIMQSHGFVEAFYIDPIDIIYRRIA